jgi:hypothetical protein
MTKEDEKTKRDWFDRISKLIVPIVGGVLVALAATVGDQMVTSYTSRQENARLITELQIQREGAEIDLRRDVFQQAIGTLLSEEELKSNQLSLSKRLLKLELLAENFGGSMSITPLFTEFDRDLEQREQAAANDLNEEVRLKLLRKRLRSVARRVSSDQVTALAARGTLFPITVDLKPGGKEFAEIGAVPGVDGNEQDAVYSRAYTWPEDEARWNLGDPEVYGDQYEDALEKEMHKSGVVTLNGIERHVSLTLGDLDPERRTVSVTLAICWNPHAIKQKFACGADEGDEIVERTFTLDFFNFPKVDNTRLSDEQRFSIVLEEFDPGGDPQDLGGDPRGQLEIAAVIFPAEYSSFRDRPSMRESLDLLNSVLRSQDAVEGERSNDEMSQM